MTSPAREPVSVRALLPRCAFPPAGSKVTCAVSGGPDSTALLALAVAAGLEVTAVHVDHGSRPGSAEEAEIVARTSGRLGASFVSLAARVEPGPGFEARARSARYGLLGRDALTGHTADDQAETVLMNVFRGTGTDGLSGIRSGPRHPLLGLRRFETRALCTGLGLETLDDPTNSDLSYRRNRVRLELLPAVSAMFERDVVPLLCRMARTCAEESRLLDELAATIDPSDAAALGAAEPVLARRALRRWLRADAEMHPPSEASTERAMAVARGEVRATELPGGVRLARSAGRLRQERTGPACGHQAAAAGSSGPPSRPDERAG
ncbi:MAG: tRNA lysidine(34) synthetase TilS [Acidimicrobiales bacterium]